MQQRFQPEDNQTPPTTNLAVSPTPVATETEAETRDTALVAERLNEITICADSVRRRSSKNFYTICACVPLLVLILSSALCLDNSSATLTVFLTLPFPVIALLWIDSARSRALPKFDAAELARTGGMEALPSLFATLQLPLSTKQNKAIENALITLLPQMKAKGMKATRA